MENILFSIINLINKLDKYLLKEFKSIEQLFLKLNHYTHL